MRCCPLGEVALFRFSSDDVIVAVKKEQPAR